MTMPMVIEISEAKMNQPAFLAPTRAIAAPPSMRATPTVRVEKHQRRNDHLERCRKLVVTNAKAGGGRVRAGPRAQPAVQQQPEKRA